MHYFQLIFLADRITVQEYTQAMWKKKFFFSWTDCHTKIKDLNLPYCLPIDGFRKKRRVHAFPLRA